jgi:SEC-C motif
MAWFSWESPPPGLYEDAQLDHLSAEEGNALRVLYDQLGSDPGPPWALLIGRLSAADAAWALAVQASRQGWRAAALAYRTLRIYPGMGQSGDDEHEWVEKAATADVCVLYDLEDPPPNPPTGDPESDFSDELVDLLLVRRRRHAGLTIITSYAPETRARQRVEAVHPGLVEQVQRYRGLTVVQVPDAPQLPWSTGEMGSVELELETTDPTLLALCRDYWATDDEGDYRFTVKELAQRHNVGVQVVAKTVTAASTARLRDRVCPSCELGEIVTSRQDLTQRQSWRFPTRECDSCVQTQRELKELSKQERFSITDSDPLSIEQLTLADATTLMALLRSQTGETFARTIPLAKWADPFAPTDDIAIEWVRRLFTNGLVLIHPDSAMDAFSWEDDDPARFYIDRVCYYVTGAGDTGERAIQAVDALTATFRDGPWPESWRSEWTEVWRELAVAECIAYLLLCLGEHNLPFKVGEKTVTVLKDMLETFSIGQAYMFIWRAARDAAAYMVRERVPAARAANSAVGNMQRGMERARAEGWQVKAFGRDRRLPVSAVSHTFFTVAMQVPDFMTAQRREVTLPKAAAPAPKPDVADESLPPGALVGPDGTVYVSPQPQRREVTISRNAPCPCGSGKKFKRCHGAPQTS